MKLQYWDHGDYHQYIATPFLLFSFLLIFWAPSKSCAKKEILIRNMLYLLCEKLLSAHLRVETILVGFLVFNKISDKFRRDVKFTPTFLVYKKALLIWERWFLAVIRRKAHGYLFGCSVLYSTLEYFCFYLEALIYIFALQ